MKNRRNLSSDWPNPPEGGGAKTTTPPIRRPQKERGGAQRRQRRAAVTHFRLASHFRFSVSPRAAARFGRSVPLPFRFRSASVPHPFRFRSASASVRLAAFSLLPALPPAPRPRGPLRPFRLEARCRRFRGHGAVQRSRQRGGPGAAADEEEGEAAGTHGAAPAAHRQGAGGKRGVVGAAGGAEGVDGGPWGPYGV